MKIINNDNEIDEPEAHKYLAFSYDDIDLLPNIPENLSKSIAATILNVSAPTIERMVQDGQIILKKHQILEYLQGKTLVNRPLNLTENSPK